MDHVDDMIAATNKVGQGLEQAEKEAARAEAALSGTIAACFDKLEATIAKLGSDGCCVGSSLAVADLMVAAGCPFLCANFFDGVPADTIERCPHIQAVRKKVMGLPEVQAHYAARPELNAFRDLRDLHHGH